MVASGRSYAAYIERQRATWGEKFSPGGLDRRFRQYYESGQRIKVTTTYADGYEHTRTGWVAATGGWAPSFMLMRRETSIGSSDLLGARDRIVAVKVGRRYVYSS